MGDSSTRGLVYGVLKIHRDVCHLRTPLPISAIPDPSLPREGLNASASSLCEASNLLNIRFRKQNGEHVGIVRSKRRSRGYKGGLCIEQRQWRYPRNEVGRANWTRPVGPTAHSLTQKTNISRGTIASDPEMKGRLYAVKKAATHG